MSAAWRGRRAALVYAQPDEVTVGIKRAVFGRLDPQQAKPILASIGLSRISAGGALQYLGYPFDDRAQFLERGHGRHRHLVLKPRLGMVEGGGG